MRPAIEAVLADLLAASEPGARVSVDAIAERIGAMAISQPEIESIFDGLEAQGREVWAPRGGDGVSLLRATLAAARSLKAAGRGVLAVAEIAAASGLSAGEVSRALLFAKILAKG